MHMPDKPAAPPQVEIIPSVEGSLSAIASANAPMLYFEEAPVFGAYNGVLRVTLTAGRLLPQRPSAPDGPYGVSRDHVVVAHLRMTVPAARLLKAAIDDAILLATPAAGDQAKRN
jgi:hypothetical protein